MHSFALLHTQKPFNLLAAAYLIAFATEFIHATNQDFKDIDIKYINNPFIMASCFASTAFAKVSLYMWPVEPITFPVAATHTSILQYFSHLTCFSILTIHILLL